MSVFTDKAPLQTLYNPLGPRLQTVYAVLTPVYNPFTPILHKFNTTLIDICPAGSYATSMVANDTNGTETPMRYSAHVPGFGFFYGEDPDAVAHMVFARTRAYSFNVRDRQTLDTYGYTVNYDGVSYSFTVVYQN